MQFKNPEGKEFHLQEQLEIIKRNPKTELLNDILQFMDGYCQGKYEKEITVTELISDDPIHKTRTHTEGRAGDVRSWNFEVEESKDIVRKLNEKFPQPGMPCCILHDVGCGEHFHIQISRSAQWNQ